MRAAVAIPPEGESSPPPPPPERADLMIIEAGASREQRCADCGRRTALWKAAHRHGMSVILCEACAAKAMAPPADEAVCPSCGALLRPGDRFCGRCGTRIEYACPTCDGGVDAEDVFCGKCGTRLA